MKYRVYFEGVPHKSYEDVVASSYLEAEAIIASRYGMAHHISATTLPRN